VFTDGERFLITAQEFREVTGLQQVMVRNMTQGITMRLCGVRDGGAVLVPQQDPHRQVHARLL
jgi:hypothetical protein